ncbi:hypothetical protein ACF06D_13960 [Streptomyces griseoluteus]|uniref:hypothetical protein n=1 Tax=Streptomyces griseoluteus TaxID=29306 RepID=UPI0036F7E515
MSDRGESLGPLERVDGRWTVGDFRRPGGAWLRFGADGLHSYAQDSEGQMIPWSRIMLVPRFTLGAKYPKGSYGVRALLGGLPGPWRGRGRGYLHMTLRHPYEDWVAPFDRHPHWYHPTELVLFGELLTQTANAGEANRFGDADWLGRAVELLARQRPRTAHEIHEAVAETREL